MGTMFQNYNNGNILILSLLLISILILAAYKLSNRSSLRWLFGLALMPSIMLLGLIHEIIFKTYSFLKVPQNDCKYFQLKVTEQVKVSDEWNVFYADCLAARNDSAWTSVHTSVQLYLANRMHISEFYPGDKLIIHAPLMRTPEPVNPGAFNYRTFFEHKGIWGTIYLKDSSSVIQVVKAKSFSGARIAFQLQDKFLSVFRKLGIAGDELGLLGALTIGVRDQIDNEINRAFAASGAMHILSVSGLHVGIIYMVFARLLSLLGRTRMASMLSLFLQIAFLWFYAFLTGLSPAVNRAAAMFSFMAIGKSINRSASSLNIVSGSALVLLLINPFLIFDIGFQLSYLAVASIILFQSRIYSLFEFKNYLADQVWNITALSLAAQLGTFPLSLLYFHQFPNYFIFTNLVVVPLAAIILYISISIIFLFWIPYISIGLAWILKISLKGMIYTVMQIEHLPFSVISNISYNILQLVLLYIMIIIIACLIHLRSRLYFFAFITFFAVFIISLIGRDIISFKDQFFIVFQQKGASIMMAGNRGHSLTLYSGKNPKLPMQAFNLTKGLCLDWRIKSHIMLCIDSLQEGKIYSVNQGVNVFKSAEKWVLIHNGRQHIAWFPAGKLNEHLVNDFVKPEVLVIAKLNQHKEYIKLKHVHSGLLVFDSSCKTPSPKEISCLSAENSVPIYDVTTSGAFIYGK